MGYIVDSNVLIDYVSERFKPGQLKILDAIFDEALTFSVITKIEILGFKGIAEEDDKMNEFVNYAEIIGLDNAIVTKQ